MKYSIKPRKDGPLMVSFEENVLFDDAGNRIEAKSGVALCRCGASQNKPFCDGMHRKIGFSSEREIEQEKLQHYPGKKITIHFNRSICAGAARCVQGLPEVFHSGSGENWIDPDGAEAEKIVETIKTCPSGALSYEMEGKRFIDERKDPKITLFKNGPYGVEAFALEETPPATNGSKSKYTLCRCGASGNKPYCDYSHAKVDFKG
ncbi:MAG TPA: hypothetical protein ENK93_00795 [Campylobacteraceae bacterium]|nr:hypothetical protein [Campylobacteraceae bacterium]